MTKQEFINLPAKNTTDWAAQQILTQLSMTAIKEVKRANNALLKVLYKEEAKKLPFTDILAAIEKAAFLTVE